MLDLIYISYLREKVRCLEGEQTPGAVSASTARERYVPWTRPEQYNGATVDPIQADGVVRAQTLRTRSTPLGQTTAEASLIFLSSPISPARRVRPA